jgi:hypothetical protein
MKMMFGFAAGAGAAEMIKAAVSEAVRRAADCTIHRLVEFCAVMLSAIGAVLEHWPNWLFSLEL